MFQNVSLEGFIKNEISRKKRFPPHVNSQVKEALLDGWTNLYRKGMPLVDLPEVIIKSGLKEIVKYFRLLDQGIDPTFRLLVMVLGQANVGKTSLIRSIEENNKGRLVKEVESRATIGIEVHKVSSKNSESNSVTEVTVLDFGGQSDYYASHSLFHRAKGLVFIVFDTSTFSKETYEAQIGFFIQKVHASDPRARFLLIGTKIDLIRNRWFSRKKLEANVLQCFKESEMKIVSAIEKEMKLFRDQPEHTRYLELYRLRENRPNLMEDKVFFVSSRMKKNIFGKERQAVGMENLSNKIHEVCLSEEILLPTLYGKLQDRINALKQISRVTTVSELIKCGIEIGMTIISDILQALKVFHDLGIILWFWLDSRVGRIVYLDPEYLMDIIKPILRHDLIDKKECKESALETFIFNNPQLLQLTKLKLSQNGIISLAILRKYFPIWKTLSNEDIQQVLNLLELFGIGYEVTNEDDDNDSSLMIPSHLGIGVLANNNKSNPELITVATPKNSRLQFFRAWEFVYFFPSGVIASLAVALHELHQNIGTFQLNAAEIILQIPFNSSSSREKNKTEAVIIDCRIRVVEDNENAIIRLEFQIFCQHFTIIPTQVHKISERIELFLQEFPGIFIRRIGKDCVMNEMIDLDLAREKAKNDKTEIQSEDGSMLLSLQRLLPELFDSVDDNLQQVKRSFHYQKSFRDEKDEPHTFFFPTSQYHCFLSHFQKEFGGECANLHLYFERLGIIAWFDRRAATITGDSMETAIADSDFYVLFLTTKVLTRKWVRFEFIRAIEMEKPILFVIDKDENFAKFDFSTLDNEDYCPKLVKDETEVVKKFCSKMSFPDIFKWMIDQSEAMVFQRRLPYEETMVSHLVSIILSQDEIIKRQNITRLFKRHWNSLAKSDNNVQETTSHLRQMLKQKLESQDVSSFKKKRIEKEFIDESIYPLLLRAGVSISEGEKYASTLYGLSEYEIDFLFSNAITASKDIHDQHIIVPSDFDKLLMKDVYWERNLKSNSSSQQLPPPSAMLNPPRKSYQNPSSPVFSSFSSPSLPTLSSSRPKTNPLGFLHHSSPAQPPQTTRLSGGGRSSSQRGTRNASGVSNSFQRDSGDQQQNFADYLSLFPPQSSAVKQQEEQKVDEHIIEFTIIPLLLRAGVNFEQANKYGDTLVNCSKREVDQLLLSGINLSFDVQTKPIVVPNDFEEKLLKDVFWQQRYFYTSDREVESLIGYVESIDRKLESQPVARKSDPTTRLRPSLLLERHQSRKMVDKDFIDFTIVPLLLRAGVAYDEANRYGDTLYGSSQLEVDVILTSPISLSRDLHAYFIKVPIGFDKALADDMFWSHKVKKDPRVKSFVYHKQSADVGGRSSGSGGGSNLGRSSLNIYRNSGSGSEASNSFFGRSGRNIYRQSGSGSSTGHRSDASIPALLANASNLSADLAELMARLEVVDLKKE